MRYTVDVKSQKTGGIYATEKCVDMSDENKSDLSRDSFADITNWIDKHIYEARVCICTFFY